MVIICPKCGNRYSGNVQRCSCGTTLQSKEDLVKKEPKEKGGHVLSTISSIFFVIGILNCIYLLIIVISAISNDILGEVFLSLLLSAVEIFVLFGLSLAMKIIIENQQTIKSLRETIRRIRNQK